MTLLDLDPIYDVLEDLVEGVPCVQVAVRVRRAIMDVESLVCGPIGLLPFVKVVRAPLYVPVNVIEIRPYSATGIGSKNWPCRFSAIRSKAGEHYLREVRLGQLHRRSPNALHNRFLQRIVGWVHLFMARFRDANGSQEIWRCDGRAVSHDYARLMYPQLYMVTQGPSHSPLRVHSLYKRDFKSSL